MTYPPPPGPPGGYPPPYGEPQYQPTPYFGPAAGQQGQPPPYPGQPGGYPPHGYPAAYPGPGYPAPAYPYAAYPVYPQPPARVSVPGVGWVLLAISIVTMVAAAMPWATVKGFNISVAGTEGDGVLTMICAAVVASMGLVIGLARGRLWASITACAFAAIITLVGVVDLADVNNLTSGDSFASDIISVGPGLVLTVVCGVVLMLASIVAIAKRSARAS